MGFFKDVKRSMDFKKISNNGLSESSNSDCCERCQYRMNNPSSQYFSCAQHRMHVGANQVCTLFERGDPLYELR